MPRTARAVVGGQCYHVINRGNGRAQIFHEPGDYRRFIALIGEAQARIELELFAACLMPNHFHLLVRPRHGTDLGEWMHWLLTTHVRRHHNHNQSSGRLWQGRFKAFLVQEDDHLLTVARYIERNALRARLVKRAEDWPWGSLSWRLGLQRGVAISACPVCLPRGWLEYVNSPQTGAELEALRACVNRQRPFGNADWTALTATELGLTSSLRPVGRPSKQRLP